jgi:hypothetical protein
MGWPKLLLLDRILNLPPHKTQMMFALRWGMTTYDELIVAKRLQDFSASCWCDNSNSDRVIITSSSQLLKMRRI